MFKKILALFAVSFMLFSCGGSSSTDTTKKMITINLGEEGNTLDHQLLTDTTGNSIHGFLSEGLTRINVETKAIEPGLAKSWDVSEDGLVYTFHLKDDIKWANGKDITANDFAYAWLRALDPKVAAEYAYLFYYIKNAEKYNSGQASAEEVGIKVIDDRTIEVTLESPTPFFVSLTSFVTYAPTSKEFVEEKGDSYALEPDTILSSGPFVMKEWVHNSEMTLVKNENYYEKDKISLDEVVIKFVADNSAALNAFKNDEIDMLKITAEQFQEFKDDPRVNMIDAAVVWYLSFNTQNKVLSNAKIRTALIQAIDKEEMVETISHGINTALYNLTPKGVGMPGYKTNDFTVETGITGPKYNVEEAKKLLQEGLAELGMTEFPVLSIILNDSGSNKKIGEAIQAYLKTNLGIDVNIELMAFKERIARMHSKNFDIVLAGWGADYQDPTTFLDLLQSKNGNNYGSYNNPKYDEALKLAQTAKTTKERFEYLKTAEEIIATEVPLGLLFQARTMYMVNPKITNYTFPAIGVDIVFSRADVK